MEKQLLTIEETAEVLSLGKTKIYQFINENELITVKFGKSRRVIAKSVEDFIERRLCNADGT
jgi:excisionase family DNA binding protein